MYRRHLTFSWQQTGNHTGWPVKHDRVFFGTLKKSGLSGVQFCTVAYTGQVTFYKGPEQKGNVYLVELYRVDNVNNAVQRTQCTQTFNKILNSFGEYGFFNFFLKLSLKIRWAFPPLPLLWLSVKSILVKKNIVLYIYSQNYYFVRFLSLISHLIYFSHNGVQYIKDIH